MKGTHHERILGRSGGVASPVVLSGSLFVALLIALSSVFAQAAPSVESATRIVFASPRSGNYEIYTMRPEGSEVV